MRKRILSVFMVFALCYSLLPVQVIAEAYTKEPEVTAATDNHNGSTSEPVLIPALPYEDEAATLLSDVAELSDADDLPDDLHGSCGEEGDGTNLTWTLNNDGILTISGVGKMADFGNETSESTAPWNDYRSRIKSVIIEDGVTTIGDIAFVYSRFNNFFIPDSVTKIEWGAFYATHVGYVYYSGTEEQWDHISISSYNDAVNDATMNSRPSLYVIRFDANGGDGTMMASHYVEGQEFLLPDCAFTAPVSATPMYYERFKAWDIDGEQVSPGSAYVFHDNTTITAVWETAKLDSGDITMPKMSREQIAGLLADNPTTLPDEIYDEIPSVTAPYRAGKVKTEVLQLAGNRLTALRAIAGLPAVELDDALCENAQYGAVLIAASEFDHYPPKPDDMDDDFYQKGLSATSSSNIHSGGNPIYDFPVKSGASRKARQNPSLFRLYICLK